MTHRLLAALALALSIAAPVRGDAPPRRDLSADEQRGGHSLARHVGRADDQLRQRLRDQPNISAASTYPDRETAERVVESVLEESADRNSLWTGGGARGRISRFASSILAARPSAVFSSAAPERRAVKKEWKAFRAATAGETLKSVGEKLTRGLGGAWAPRRRSDLDALDALIDGL